MHASCSGVGRVCKCGICANVLFGVVRWVAPSVASQSDAWLSQFARGCPLDQTGQNTFANPFKAEEPCQLQSKASEPDSLDLTWESCMTEWYGVLYGASTVHIGSDVQGLAFFDNKLDESHIAVRCCAM